MNTHCDRRATTDWSQIGPPLCGRSSGAAAFVTTLGWGGRAHPARRSYAAAPVERSATISAPTPGAFPDEPSIQDQESE